MDEDIEFTLFTADDAPVRCEEVVAMQQVYTAACRRFRVRQCQKFLNQCDNQSVGLSVSLRHMQLDDAIFKAIAAALVFHDNVVRVDFSNNQLGARAAAYLRDFVYESTTIKLIDVSNNPMGGAGAEAIGDLLTHTNTLTCLRASGNSFLERDALFFVKGLETNTSVLLLDLSHNGFSEEGGMLLGHVLAENSTLEVLNLSWNHLRQRGAKAIAIGLKKNDHLMKIDLSYNGFDDDDVTLLAEVLADGDQLVHLNLTGNHVGAVGALALAKGLSANSTLEVLKLSQNPLTTEGAAVMVVAVHENDQSKLTELDLTGIPVTYDTVALSNAVSYRRLFVLIHGVVVSSADVLGQRPVDDRRARIDPFHLLMVYCDTSRLRLTELFAQLDKDHNGYISYDELRTGIKIVGIPIPPDKVEELLLKIDIDRDGKIVFSELLQTQKEYRMRIRKNKALATALAQENDIRRRMRGEIQGAVRAEDFRSRTTYFGGCPKSVSRSQSHYSMHGSRESEGEQTTTGKLFTSYNISISEQLLGSENLGDGPETENPATVAAEGEKAPLYVVTSVKPPTFKLPPIERKSFRNRAPPTRTRVYRQPGVSRRTAVEEQSSKQQNQDDKLLTFS